VNALAVTTPTGPAGTLAREAGLYQFTCAAEADARSAISLTMPVRRRAYAGASLPPIFQMNQPEGFLRERLRHLLAKSTADDPALTMALLPGDAAIGRVFLSREGTSPATTTADAGESLQHILRYQGAEGLFDTLLERYLLRSGVSGVQPKVLVPERVEPRADGLDMGMGMAPPARATAVTHDLIVKSGLDEFPGLAINEFVCMTAVARAGVPCPPFYLSDNTRLFVMRRFDRTPGGGSLGFEDMAVLCGLDAERKYSGSYERVARVIEDNCAADRVMASLYQLFDMVALSCILGNGDAHLKNFGLLYTDPQADDATLAPAFDIVNTTCYLPGDALALSLDGNRSLFAARLGLLAFGQTCRLTPGQVRRRMGELVGAVQDTVVELRGLAEGVPGLVERLTAGVAAFGAGFPAGTG
jgi:serine/threonine-protein kinase HipA